MPTTTHASWHPTRREILGVAGSAAVGCLLGQDRVAQASSVKERSCIFIWLNGGPSQFETFDPKPNAADDVRGPFGAIQTSVPGVRVSELIPNLAKHFDKYSIVRALSHRNPDHGSTAMLTGMEGGDIPYGAVVTKLLGPAGPMPAYVHIGSSKGDGTQFVSAVDNLNAGALGSAYAPLRVRTPMGSGVQLGDFSLHESVPLGRFDERRQLLGSLGNREPLTESEPGRKLAEQRQRVAEILSSTRVRDAFDLNRESESLRYRYGANHFGQSCLLARRLVEAGTRYVQIKWYHVAAFDAWDTHGADLPGMRRTEQQLCPRLDMGLAALLEDLDQRGLLDTTLVAVVGEFGRTPTLNKNGDRDHWPHCFSSLMAGAGIEGGTVVGASDAKGAYPATDSVSPADFAATIYRLVGIDTAGDLRIRPFIQNGLPIKQFVG
jgi:hypothetical protein